MKFQLPTYEFLVDDTDESGVSTISLVTQPAMKSSFIAFDTDEKKTKYVFIQKDEKEYKGIVAGLSMIPNKLIYRIGDDGEEYNGYFTAQTIEKIRNKYHRNPDNLTSVNMEHSNAFVNAYLVESYILDSPAMVEAVKAKGIAEACLGSWYTAFKVENKDVFQACLDGTFNGFSVEAYLDRELKMSVNKFNKNNTKKMKKNLVERLRERVNKILAEANFEDALCPELNVQCTWGAVGETVTKTYNDATGKEVTEPIGEGTFVLEDGRSLVVDANSGLTEILPAVEQPAPPEVPPVEIPVPKVPAVSGDTAVSGSTAPVVAPLAEVVETAEELACKKKKLDEVIPMASGSTAPVVDVATKTLGEIVDVSKDGEYEIWVKVEGGAITEAEVNASQDLVPSTGTQDGMPDAGAMMAEIKQKFADAQAEITALKAKLAEPIGEPVLGHDDKKKNLGVVKELTVYEIVAKRNGLPVM